MKRARLADEIVLKKQNKINKIKIFFKSLLIAITITRLWAISLHYLFQNNRQIMDRIVNDSFHHYQVGIVFIVASYLFRKKLKPEITFAIGLGIFLEEWPVFLNDLGLTTNKLYLSLPDFILIIGLIVLTYILLLTKIQTTPLKNVKNRPYVGQNKLDPTA